MDRVRFITHQGKRVLLVDLTNCGANDVMKVMAEVQRIVTVQPRESTLTLGDLTGAQFSRGRDHPHEGGGRVRPAVREAVSHCRGRRPAQGLLRGAPNLLPAGISLLSRPQTGFFQHAN